MGVTVYPPRDIHHLARTHRTVPSIFYYPPCHHLKISTTTSRSNELKIALGVNTTGAGSLSIDHAAPPHSDLQDPAAGHQPRTVDL